MEDYTRKRLVSLGLVPPTPVEADLWYNNVSKHPQFYDGAKARTIATINDSPTVFDQPAGFWTVNAGMNAVAGSAYTTARLNVLELAPVDLPTGKAYDQCKSSVSVAVSGGTAVVLRMGVYLDDGSGCRPSTLVQEFGTYNPTIAGNIAISWTTPAPGRYWIAKVYQYTTAPTTHPTVQIVNSAPLLPNTAQSGIVRGWSTGTAVSGALPSTVVGQTFTGLATPDIVGLRAA